MTTKKLGREPAFPVDEQTIQYNQSGIIPYACHGLSKRLYLAGMAMQGLLSNPNTAKQISSAISNPSAEQSRQIVMKESLLMADELLKQEAE